EPDAARVIRPFLGSVEMNTRPSTTSDRFAITLTGMEAREVAARYPAVYRHLSRTVRRQRARAGERRLRERWWQFSRPAHELYRQAAALARVLVSGRVATWQTFTFQAPTTVFSDQVTVFTLESWGAFALLQSDVHGLWARCLGSSFRDDPRYIPEGCFETFPFPTRWRARASLDAAGRRCYEFRAALMLATREGLTKTYHRYHDPAERAPDIVRLRALHAAMDRAVLDTYGWKDISDERGFFLEHALDGAGRGRRPWRYRWPDATRDELLARLLELNERRHAEELAARVVHEARASAR
ncbi:MAG: hypothetical protein KC468_38835, partial [Myxococcales bacterium]|nr:hypothetical protein [Myxococcales bacterium]